MKNRKLKDCKYRDPSLAKTADEFFKLLKIKTAREQSAKDGAAYRRNLTDEDRNRKQIRWLRRLARRDYRAYLKTEHWKAKRSLAIEYFGDWCSCCGSKDNIQVHHRHYRSLGNEDVHDLQVLCDECHSLRHESQGVVARDEVSAEFRVMFGK